MERISEAEHIVKFNDLADETYAVALINPDPHRRALSEVASLYNDIATALAYEPLGPRIDETFEQLCDRERGRRALKNSEQWREYVALYVEIGNTIADNEHTPDEAYEHSYNRVRCAWRVYQSWRVGGEPHRDTVLAELSRLAPERYDLRLKRAEKSDKPAPYRCRGHYYVTWPEAVAACNGDHEPAPDCECIVRQRRAIRQRESA